MLFRSHLVRRFGDRGPDLKLLARGIDDTPVDDGGERKSLGREMTLDDDIADPEALETLLLGLVEEVSYSLRSEGLLARTVTLKLKDAEFQSITRQVKLAQPSDLAGPIFEAARALLEKTARGSAYRLIGVSTSDLGEEEQLAGERSDMQKGERIAEDLKTVLESFDGPKSGLSLIRSAARKLDRLADAHPLLAEALTSLDRAVIEASDAEDKLNAAARAIEYEPARLDEIEERLFELRALARKHNIAPDGIIALQERLTSQLHSIEAGGEGLALLEAEVAAKHNAYVQSASALSAARTAAAVKLDAAVKNELAPLKLDAAQFQTAVEKLPEDRWTAYGIRLAMGLLRRSSRLWPFLNSS